MDRRTASSIQIKRQRLFAFTADLFIVVILNKVLINTYVLFLTSILYQMNYEHQLEAVASLDNVVFSSFIATYLLYQIIGSWMNNGQTVGRALFNLKLQCKDGNELGFVRATVRSMMHLMSFMTLFLPFISIFFTKRAVGLHDLLTRSEVVAVPVAELIPLPVEPEEESKAA